MGVQIFLHFDNPSSTFRPGQIITGNVSVNTSRLLVVKGLTLSFHGEGQVLWTESNTSTQTSAGATTNHRHQHYNHTANITGPHRDSTTVVREYRNQETYLNNFFALPIGECGLGSTQTPLELPAGFYQHIPFTFQLPLNIPTSCKLKYGSIEYYALASLKIQQSLLVFTTETSKTAKKQFTLLGCLDLASRTGALLPVQLQLEEQFKLLCCSCGGGEFAMDLKLARTGFVAGEQIVFQLDYRNSSNVTVKRLEAYLTEKLLFTTFSKEKQETYKCNTVFREQRIFPRTSGNWYQQLRIPPNTYLTDLGGCRIIHVGHFLTIKACGSFGRSVKIKVPITIGTMSGDGIHRMN